MWYAKLGGHAKDWLGTITNCTKQNISVKFYYKKITSILSLHITHQSMDEVIIFYCKKYKNNNNIYIICVSRAVFLSQLSILILKRLHNFEYP